MDSVFKKLNVCLVEILVFAHKNERLVPKLPVLVLLQSGVNFFGLSDIAIAISFVVSSRPNKKYTPAR